MTDLDLNALGVTMQGELRASEIDSSEPDVSVSLELRGADLGLPFKVAGIEPLASRLAEAAPRGFTLSADLDADLKRGDIDVSTLSAQLLGAAFNAQIKARNIRSDTPAMQGSLRAAGPDLPTLLWTLGQFQGGANARLAGYGALLADTPTKAFQLETAFDVDLKSGDVTVSELSLDALGITASGSLEASNMRSRKGAARGNLALRARRPVALLRVLDQPGLEQTLQSVTLDAELRGTGEALNLEPLSLELAFNDARLTGGAARLRLDADARMEPDKGILRLGRFDLRGLGLQTTGHAVVRDVFGEPDYSGQAQTQPVDLRELAQRLGWPMPTGADPDAFAKVALGTRFAGTATELDLNNLQLQLDDSRLNGDLTLRAAPASPALEFKLELDEIDLDRYLPTRADAAGDSRPLMVPVDALRALTMDGALKIGSLVVSDVALQQATLRLSAKSGELRADPLTATLYDGRFAGALALNVNPDLPRLAINSTLQGAQVGPLLEDIHGKAVLRGAGDLTTNLLTSGADSEQLKRNLHGRVSVYLREGAIAGLNLGRTLRAWKQYKKGGLAELRETETSDFSELTGNAVITAGVVRMDDLSVKAPAFRLRGSGVLADLRTDTIDYRTLVAVVNTARGAGGRELAELDGLELPVNITGALDDPRVALDWGSVLGPIIVEGLLDALNVSTSPPNRSAEGETPGSEGTDRQSDAEDLTRELLKEGLKNILRR